jgi:plasmid stability protein
MSQVQVGWRLPEGLVRLVRVRAAERGVSANAVVVEALESALEGVGTRPLVSEGPATPNAGYRGPAASDGQPAPSRAPRRAASLSETWAR